MTGGLASNLNILETCIVVLQVVRMRLEEGRRIVGTLIPGTAMDPLIRTLKAGAESSDTYIQEVTIDD
jgi:hypothetical protein